MNYIITKCKKNSTLSVAFGLFGVFGFCYMLTGSVVFLLFACVLYIFVYVTSLSSCPHTFLFILTDRADTLHEMLVNLLVHSIHRKRATSTGQRSLRERRRSSKYCNRPIEVLANINSFTFSYDSCAQYLIFHLSKSLTPLSEYTLLPALTLIVLLSIYLLYLYIAF